MTGAVYFYQPNSSPELMGLIKPAENNTTFLAIPDPILSLARIVVSKSSVDGRTIDVQMGIVFDPPKQDVMGRNELVEREEQHLRQIATILPGGEARVTMDDDEYDDCGVLIICGDPEELKED